MDDVGAGPKPFWRGPANGGILPWPPRLCPGSWPAWAQAMRFLMWAGLGRCPGACLPPFQSSTPLLEPSGSFGSLRKRPGYPLGSRPMHHRGFQGLALARLVGGTVLDSVYKPVYPSIYMLYRMYICWEHARFCVSLLCVVCSTAQSPKLALAGVGATVMPLPQCNHRHRRHHHGQSPPVRLCSQLCPRFNRPDAAPPSPATSCTYDCKMVNVCIISGLVI